MTISREDRADAMAQDFILDYTKLPLDGVAHRALTNRMIIISELLEPELNDVKAENTRLRAVLASHGIAVEP